MRNKILTITALSLMAAPAMAAGKKDANKHEAAGLGSGVVVGAIAGGPIGAILGGVAGGWFGDRFGKEHKAKLEFEQRYGEAQANADELERTVDSLEDSLVGSERKVSSLESQMLAEERAYRSALQQALNTQVFFRTAESALHEDSIASLGRMAQLINSIDGFVIRLEGHADSRGDEQYNVELSEARANSVRDALIAAGFPANRISVTAVGETQAQAEEKDLDALALERRVHIELVGMDEATRVARE